MYSEERITIPLEEDIFNKLSVAAVKYACGRATYVPEAVSRVIKGNIRNLNLESREEIVSHIDEHGKRDALGWDCDRDTWIRLEEAIKDPENSYDGPKELEIMTDIDLFWLFVGSAYRRDKATDDPKLEAREYEDILRSHENILNDKWTYNLLRDTVEAFGINWIEEEGPIRDREGFISMYKYLKGLYDDIDEKVTSPLNKIPELMGV